MAHGGGERNFEYEHGKFTSVEFYFTISRPEIQAEGGASEIGKVYRNNQGISFVRADREIMLHTEYLEPDPRERWWSCEIKFNHEADNNIYSSIEFWNC